MGLTVRVLGWAMIATGIASPALAQEEGANERVLLWLDPTGRTELVDALASELATRGLTLEHAVAPPAETPLARAAGAQAIARARGAVGALFVEPHEGGGEMLVLVGAEDGAREAPLPAASAEIAPRVFALIAASLLDELLAGAELPIRVRVEVHVDAPGRPVDVQWSGRAVEQGNDLGPPVVVGPPDAPPAPPAPAPVGPAAQIDSADTAADGEPIAVPHIDRWMVGVAIPLGYGSGGQLHAGFYPTPRLRIEAQLGALAVPETSGVGYAAVGLSWIKQRLPRIRRELGFDVAFVVRGDEDDEGWWQDEVEMGPAAVAHVGWMWDLRPHFSLGLRLNGSIAVFDGDEVTPWAFATLRMEVGS
jgi:hypothetical protein